MNVDQVRFAVRIRLDGEQVYLDRSTSVAHHVVELERSHAPGPHEIQFEILDATRRRSTFQAHVTWAPPTGPSFSALGVPTTLAVGEQLTLKLAT
jgi:hypothetical protein